MISYTSVAVVLYRCLSVAVQAVGLACFWDVALLVTLIFGHCMSVGCEEDLVWCVCFNSTVGWWVYMCACVQVNMSGVSIYL